jgi:hypothetical protein
LPAAADEGSAIDNYLSLSRGRFWKCCREERKAKDLTAEEKNYVVSAQGLFGDFHTNAGN